MVGVPVLSIAFTRGGVVAADAARCWRFGINVDGKKFLSLLLL